MLVHIVVNVYSRPSGGPIRRRPVAVSEGTSVEQLLDMLSREGNMPVKFGEGEGYSEFLVLLNGLNVMCGDDIKSELYEGDEVSVMPAVAGG